MTRPGTGMSKKRIAIQLCVFVIGAVVAAILFLVISEWNLDTRKLLEVKADGQLEQSITIPCNRFFLREVGLVFEPPVVLERISDRKFLIEGVAEVEISQGGVIKNAIEMHLDQPEGVYYKPDGVYMWALYRYPVLQRFCTKQRIRVTIPTINLNLDHYSVFLYISNDRRR